MRLDSMAGDNTVCTILLLDSDTLLVEKVCKRLNMQPVVAKDYQSAVAALADIEKLAVIILNIDLVTCFEAVEFVLLLKVHFRHKHTFVIFVSAGDCSVLAKSCEVDWVSKSDLEAMNRKINLVGESDLE